MINTYGSFSRKTRKLKKLVFPYIACGGKSVREICASEGSNNRIPASIYKITLRVP